MTRRGRGLRGLSKGLSLPELLKRRAECRLSNKGKKELKNANFLGEIRLQKKQVGADIKE